MKKSHAIQTIYFSSFSFSLSVPNQCIVARTIQDRRSLKARVSKIALLSSIKMGAELWHVNLPVSLVKDYLEEYSCHNTDALEYF